MNGNNKIWGTLLKVALGLILVLSFLQVKMKFGWDPIGSSCQKPPSILIKSITLSDSVMNIEANNTKNLLAQIEPANATNQNLKWSSIDTTVTMVDPTTGHVTTTSKGGECIITAAATDESGTSAKIKIKVNRETNDSVFLVKTIDFLNSSGEIILNPESIFEIDAKARPEEATNKTLAWKSDKEGIATVNNGIVTGKSVGKCTITASSTDGGSVHKSIKVRVQQPNTDIKVSSISFDKSTLTINIGDKKQVVAKVLPVDATNKTLKWESNNEGVATVDNGVVTGRSAGECTITAFSTDGGSVHKSTKVHVVKIPVTPISNTPSLRGNTIEEKIKNGLAYFSDSRNDIENKAIVATQMSKLFDDEAVVIVKRQNFDRVNPNAKDYITIISTSKQKVTYVGHKVNAKGLITELTVKQY